MKQIVILYHAECPDGFGGAWAAHKKFGDSAEYIGVHHEAPPPEGLVDKEVYMVDFTYPVDILKEIISKNKRVTAIDHHASMEEAIKLTQDYSYGNDNSGSVLAWKYFHKDSVPKLLEYVEDRDLYKFSLPNSRAICAFIDSFDYNFSVWDELAINLENADKRNDLIEKGNLIVKYEEELVKKIIEDNARLVEFEGYKIYSVNAPHEFASDIGNILYKRNPPMAIIWREDKDKVSVSLRSDGTVDVGKIAAKFGGGGHRDSSGFVIKSIHDIPWKDRK